MVMRRLNIHRLLGSSRIVVETLQYPAGVEDEMDLQEEDDVKLSHVRQPEIGFDVLSECEVRSLDGVGPSLTDVVGVTDGIETRAREIFLQERDAAIASGRIHDTLLGETTTSDAS